MDLLAVTFLGAILFFFLWVRYMSGSTGRITKKLSNLRYKARRNPNTDKIVSFEYRNCHYDSTDSFLNAPVLPRRKRHNKGEEKGWCPCDFCASNRAIYSKIQ